MTRSTRRRSVALLALSALATALSGSAPAGAAGPTSHDFPGCRAYGSASGYGVVCAGPGGGGVDIRTWIDHDLPECWHEEPPADFVPPRTGVEGRWWLQTCLGGIDLHTLVVRPGGLTLAYGYVRRQPGEEHRLTTSEERVVDALVTHGQVPLPFPRVRVSPSSSPRVGEVVAFSLDGPGQAPPLDRGGIQMEAHVVSLTVEPLGEGGPTVTCTGTGRVLTAEDVVRADGDPRALGPDVCAWRYDRSSYRAGTGDAVDRYPVRVTTAWAVTYRRGPETGELGPFDKSADNQVRVAEVQTLVVS